MEACPIRRGVTVARGVARAVLIGLFVAVSFLGDPATTLATFVRAVANPPTRAGSGTEEEHVYRIEAAAKESIRWARRKAPSRPIPRGRASIVPHTALSGYSVTLTYSALSLSEHSMRNSIGGPLRC